MAYTKDMNLFFVLLFFPQLEFYTKNYFGILWCHFRSVKKQTRVLRLFTAIFGL